MQDDPDTDNPDNSLKTATNELARGYKKEKSAAKRVLHDAQDAVTQKASEVATEAKDALLGQAADKQKDIGASLGAFGGALRARCAPSPSRRCLENSVTMGATTPPR